MKNIKSHQIQPAIRDELKLIYRKTETEITVFI